LAGAFDRNALFTICQQDLSAAETAIGQQVRGLAGSPCLTRDIVLPPDCTVTATSSMGTTQIPACGASTTDCFTINADSAACPLGQHLELMVTPSALPPADTTYRVRCKV